MPDINRSIAMALGTILSRAGFVRLAAGVAHALGGASLAAGATNTAQTDELDASAELAAADAANAAPQTLTRLNFCAAITKGYGTGDCILLTNVDEEGTTHHAMVDVGRNLPTAGNTSTATLDYLHSHGVERLEFVLITHQHGDHHGDAVNVLKTFPVETLYMKQYDAAFSTGNPQSLYEAILKEALSRGVRVVGVAPDAIDPSYERVSQTSPSLSADFKTWVEANRGVLDLCEEFNLQNTSFALGSAQLEIVNWEQWGTQGGAWNNAANDEHEFVSNENNNSLGVILRQGEKVAFLAGDMNNSDGTGATGVGDETRLAPVIGKVDFLKLGHHGYADSNTTGFLNTLLPDYAQITNDLGRPHGDALSWLEDHGTSYAFTTSDPVGTEVVMTDDKVTMSVESHDRFTRSGTKAAFVPSDDGGAMWPVSYTTRWESVSTWGELRALVKENAASYSVDAKAHKVMVEALFVDVSQMGRENATYCIEIEAGQRIKLLARDEVVITRAPSLADESLFHVMGDLTIDGPVVLDGNREGVDACTASLVSNDGGVVSLRGATLRNNCKRYSKQGDGVALRGVFGGGIVSYGGLVRLEDGATVTGNECVFEEHISVSDGYADWLVGGGGVASMGGYVSVNGARIADNAVTLGVGFQKLDVNARLQYMVSLARGGGLYVVEGKACVVGSLTLENNTVFDSSYLMPGTTGIDFTSGAYGAGMFVKNTHLFLRNSHVAGNRCLEGSNVGCSGLGVSALGRSISLVDVEIAEHEGAGTGGAIYAKDAVVYLNRCTIAGNSAAEQGGGLYVAGGGGSRLEVRNSVIEGNVAQEDGGAVWADCPTIVTGSKFESNVASGYGASIDAGHGLVVDAGCSFAGNQFGDGDVSVGRRGPCYLRVDPVDVNVAFGEGASNDPVDERPTLTAEQYPCGPEKHAKIIDVAVSSATGILSVTVDGARLMDPRYVALEPGLHVVQVKDLAGRETSERLAVELA